MRPVSTLHDHRRYLTNFDSWRTGHIFTDVLVIGGGSAGASAALEAATLTDNVLVVCKSGLSESTTRYAQGGIAAVRATDDSIETHIEDTLRVGCGLCRRDAVEILVRGASERIDELVEWGMRFDLTGGTLALTREGGHSVSRVLHAEGDATGREMSRVLCERLRANENIRIFDDCFLIDLITHEGRCVGAITFNPEHGHQLIWARQTILASGGAGRIYRETSNPPVATGDGYAAAYRAGARLADIEMVQFHPTTLYVAGAARALISEAVRGEGAVLVDRDGTRFMESYHPDGELAPRDVVSRAIFQQMRETRTNCVHLDARGIGAERFAKRFPGITKLCRDFQIDAGRELIPVRPAAHYMVGGVLTDTDGTTSLDGLLCCGEVACTGVHGANRLASNSLLEGLVFGTIAGRTAGTRAGNGPEVPSRGRISSANPPSQRTELDLQDIRNSLRSLMWRNAGIERDGERLTESREIIEFWGHYVLDKTFDDTQGWETQNMLGLSRLIVIAARERERSIGVHYRTDGDAADQSKPLRHLSVHRGEDGLRLGRLDLDYNPCD